MLWSLLLSHEKTMIWGICFEECKIDLNKNFYIFQTELKTNFSQFV